MSKDLVVKANVLVEAGYQLTTNEQRLILCAIAAIPKGEPIDPNVSYCVSKSNFVNLGVNPKTANRELREACDRLFNRYVMIKTDEKEFKTRWIQDITKYDQEWALHNKDFFVNAIGEDLSETDCILAAITFSRSIIPFLTELKSNFTKYMLSDVAGFASSYSFRFYEFIMQYKSSGFLKISLSALRERLDLVDKYPATKDLRLWVIEVAINEINEKSPYNIKYRLIKTGRKYTHLELSFKPKYTKPKKDSILTWQEKGLSDKQIAKLAVFQTEFIDKNNDPELLRLGGCSDTAGYHAVFESWKPFLKEPENLSKFQGIQDFLDR